MTISLTEDERRQLGEYLWWYASECQIPLQGHDKDSDPDQVMCECYEAERSYADMDIVQDGLPITATDLRRFIRNIRSLPRIGVPGLHEAERAAQIGKCLAFCERMAIRCRREPKPEAAP